MPATRDRSAAHGEPAGGGPVAQALPSGVGGSERQRDRPGDTDRAGNQDHLRVAGPPP